MTVFFYQIDAALVSTGETSLNLLELTNEIKR